MRRPYTVKPKIDFLKNLKICRYWVKSKYKLNLNDLEMLLFLHTEGYFTREQFNNYKNIMPWSHSKFFSLRKDGWITAWREQKGREAALWEISHKGKRVVTEFYQRLTGEKLISETPGLNPMFKKSASYTDKVFRHAIKQSNKDIIKQRQRRALE
jgi:hypothetical protein